MSRRRREFSELLPLIVGRTTDRAPVHLRQIYEAIERDHSHLIDDEVDSSGAVRWKHELRWELESLIVSGTLRRRKDLGPAMYSR